MNVQDANRLAAFDAEQRGDLALVHDRQGFAGNLIRLRCDAALGHDLTRTLIDQIGTHMAA